jgi:hypothetical protein
MGSIKMSAERSALALTNEDFVRDQRSRCQAVATPVVVELLTRTVCTRHPLQHITKYNC